MENSIYQNSQSILNTATSYLTETIPSYLTETYQTLMSNSFSSNSNNKKLDDGLNASGSLMSLEHTNSSDPLDQCRNYISRKDRPRRGKREKTGRVTKLGSYLQFDQEVMEYFKMYKTVSRSIKSTIDSSYALGQQGISSLVDGTTVLTDTLLRKSYPPFKSDKIPNMSIASLSFSGGGYNCAYHLGIVKYIFEHSDMFTNVTFLGASGGAGVAAIALAYQDYPNRMQILQKILTTLIKMADEGYTLSEQVNRYTTLLLDNIDLECFDSKIRNSPRLQISVTDINNIIPINKIVTKIRDLEHLEKTIRASACVPILLDSQIREVDGTLCLDGGFTNNLPALNTNTIRVSCLNFPTIQAEVHPNKYMSLKSCFIHPGEQAIIQMMEEGYVDFVNFIGPYLEKQQDKALEIEIERLEQEFMSLDT